MDIRWIGPLLLTLPLAAPAAADQTNRFVGSEVCKTCHANVWLNFYKNPHFKSVASGKETPEMSGCEGCHGPGGNHIAANGGKATIKVFSTLTPTETLDTCLGCHSKDISKSNIRRSPHTEANVVCTNCHS